MMSNDKRRILIAEDNRVLADVLRFNLQRSGFEAIVAANGSIAIEHLRNGTFDLLITDFQMPGVNGEQLCHAVRNQLDIQHMPILMCSAKGLEMNIEDITTRYGVSKIIYKPFSMREVVSVVQTLTDSKPLSLNA
jgi:two-component system chemotaxis response regulator CheY